jgi:hypothetical protein
VLAAIDFDDQSRLVTGEVGNELPDRRRRRNRHPLIYRDRSICQNAF